MDGDHIACRVIVLGPKESLQLLGVGTAYFNDVQRRKHGLLWTAHGHRGEFRTGYHVRGEALYLGALDQVRDIFDADMNGGESA